MFPAAYFGPGYFSGSYFPEIGGAAAADFAADVAALPGRAMVSSVESRTPVGAVASRTCIAAVERR